MNKEKIMSILFVDGNYYNNFTEDSAKDYFFTQHRKMTKKELLDILSKELPKSRYMKKELERVEE